ncbi:hypothetical protein B0A50_07356 [Salinomyces thailandicus]|uniref:GATA-type domain-containing protein n=1 Tax=Salinomyces thailandicus TaxID=706561 RepID=A0A4V5N3E6_9PEZI|nr:hypothetical protein B0A50_07356 [Salinomyces thailandica]
MDGRGTQASGSHWELPGSMRDHATGLQHMSLHPGQSLTSEAPQFSAQSGGYAGTYARDGLQDGGGRLPGRDVPDVPTGLQQGAPPTHDYVAREVARTVLRNTDDLYQASWAAKVLDPLLEAELCRTIARHIEGRDNHQQKPKKKRKRRHVEEEAPQPEQPSVLADVDQTQMVAFEAPVGQEGADAMVRFVCTECGTRDTARWRNGRNGKVCNACGIAYLKKRKKEKQAIEDQQDGEGDDGSRPMWAV